jgi:phage tail sheath gpL-like
MAIGFNNIPTNLRVPLFYAEVDNSQAGTLSQEYNILCVGYKNTDSDAALHDQLLTMSVDQAKQLFGVGSMLARMVEIIRKGDTINPITCIAVDSTGLVTAEGKITITGSATTGGMLVVYIGAQRIRIAVAKLEAAESVCSRLAAAINAVPEIAVTATVTTTEVTLTSKVPGELGNSISVIPNFYGTINNEVTPKGLTVTITPMAGGAGAPDLTPVVAAMGDEPFDFICNPFNDLISMEVLGDAMNDTAGRWAWDKQIYGHVYSAKHGMVSELAAYGTTSNDQHISVFSAEPLVPNPAWEIAAAFTAANSQPISIDPARPTQTIMLAGITPAPKGKRFILAEKQLLLFKGMATGMVTGGKLRIERAVTRYQKNLWDQADASYLDSETLHQIAYILRDLKSCITQKYPRHKLANDGTRFGEGQPILTPSVAKGEICARYAKLEDKGIVENSKAFAENLIVERNADNPNRLDVLLPPDLVNQLRIFAVLMQFRLQY